MSQGIFMSSYGPKNNYNQGEKAKLWKCITSTLLFQFTLLASPHITHYKIFQWVKLDGCILILGEGISIKTVKKCSFKGLDLGPSQNLEFSFLFH